MVQTNRDQAYPGCEGDETKLSHLFHRLLVSSGDRGWRCASGWLGRCALGHEGRLLGVEQ